MKSKPTLISLKVGVKRKEENQECPLKAYFGESGKQRKIEKRFQVLGGKGAKKNLVCATVGVRFSEAKKEGSGNGTGSKMVRM